MKLKNAPLNRIYENLLLLEEVQGIYSSLLRL